MTVIKNRAGKDSLPICISDSKSAKTRTRKKISQIYGNEVQQEYGTVLVKFAGLKNEVYPCEIEPHSLEDKQAIIEALQQPPSTIEIQKAVEKAVQPYSNMVQNAFPQIESDRFKAQIAFIKKSRNCTENEKTAALLRIDGMSLRDISKRVLNKNGKRCSYEGVRQMLIRFERKTGNPNLFPSETYRQKVKRQQEIQDKERERQQTKY